MALYYIGKIIDNPNKPPVAYKIYNSQTSQSEIISRKDVREALKKGYKVRGLRILNHPSGVQLLDEQKGVYNISHMPSLKGDGTPEDNSNKSLVFIGNKGFKEVTKYVFIDSACNRYEFSKEELIQQIKNGLYTIGLLLDSNSIIKIHRDYKEQLY